jgi:hypothetical protein
VGELPWLNPADVRGVKPQEGKKIINFFFFFVGRRRPRGAPRGRLRPGGKQQQNFIYLFLNFFFPPWGLVPRTSAGLSHGSPPFDFEVAFWWLF